MASIDNKIMAMEAGYSRWRVTFHPPDSSYEIVHMNSGLVIDLESGGASPGTVINTFPAHGGQNQRWKIEQLDQGPLVVYSLMQPHLCMTATTDSKHYIIRVVGDENSTSPRARWYFKKA
ncbi:hypothetical protein DFP73DRAFT_594791 [Morchella snyderi]|nr:hypothetical protein DFP73DRAFT_594791 [Morchella snyderi]